MVKQRGWSTVDPWNWGNIGNHERLGFHDFTNNNGGFWNSWTYMTCGEALKWIGTKDFELQFLRVFHMGQFGVDGCGWCGCSGGAPKRHVPWFTTSYDLLSRSLEDIHCHVHQDLKTTSRKTSTFSIQPSTNREIKLLKAIVQGGHFVWQGDHST